MNAFLAFVLVLFSSLSAFANVTPELKAELEKWGVKQIEATGVLLTPPTGNLDSQTQSTLEFIKNLIEELAGDKLKGKNLIVSLYSSDIPNAFMAEHNPENKRGLEFKWLKKNPATAWPLREAYGFQNNKDSIFELGITLGLLRLTETTDELAFVLYHELRHLLEGHTQNDRGDSHGLKTWWSSQQHEAVADDGAIDGMVGRYELNSAITILAKLARDQNRRYPHDKTEVSDVFQDLGSSHHHEGVRIALTQSKIEWLRRTNAAAKPRALTPLPSFTQIERHSRQRQIDNPAFDILMESTEIVDSFLKGDFSWVFSLSGMTKAANTPKSYNEYREKPEREPTDEQLAKGLMLFVDRIDKAEISGHQKTEAFLWTLYLFASNLARSPEFVWPGVTVDDLDRISYKLASWSTGAAGFRFETFKQHLDSLSDESYTGSFHHIFYTGKAESLFHRLYTLFPEWQKLVHDQPQMALYRKDKPNPMHLKSFAVDLFNLTLEPRATPLRDISKADVFEIFKNHNPEEWVDFSFEEKDSQFLHLLLGLNTEILSARENEADAEKLKYLESLQAQLEKSKMKFKAERDPLALEYLKNHVGKNENLTSFLKNLIFTVSLIPVDDSTLREMLPYLVTLSKENTDENHLTQDFEIAPILINTIFRILGYSDISKQDKIALLRFLAGITKPSLNYNYTDFDPTRDQLINFIGTMRTEEVIELMNQVYVGGETRAMQSLEENTSARAAFEAWKIANPDHDPDLLHMNPLHNEIMWTQLRYQDAVRHTLFYRLNFLSYLGVEAARNQGRVEMTSLADLQAIIRSAQEGHEKYSATVRLADRKSSASKSADAVEIDDFIDEVTTLTSNDAADFLIQTLIQHQNSIQTIEEWYELYSFIRKRNKVALEVRQNTLPAIRDHLKTRLSALKGVESAEWMKKKYILDVLDGNYVAEELIRSVKELGLDSAADRERLFAELKRVATDFELEKEHTEIFITYRNLAAEEWQMQPSELTLPFPESEESKTVRSSAFSTEIRGLSAMAAQSRRQSIPEQIAFIEFLAGRSREVPAFILKLSEENSDYPIFNAVWTARSSLRTKGVLERAFVINSLLAGPTGIAEKPEGIAALKTHFLKNVKPENKEFAEAITDALISSQEDMNSLAFAYIFAQKSEQEDTPITESQILSSLFSAFGVPGIKLAQYIAFTSAMKEYQDAFEDAQDNALPLDHFTVLKMIQNRYQGAWPTDFKIVRTIGSGSVNIAVQFYNPVNQRNEVLQISRDDIKVQAAHDFRRINKLIDELIKTESGKKQFGFLKGLIGIIEESVTLEFDKANSFNIQRAVQDLYHREVNGWSVRSVDVLSLDQEKLTIVMEMAAGRSAKKVKNENFAAYKEAMSALAEVELNHLFGMDHRNIATPISLFSNPDIHDGQVLIDVDKKELVILDFGQAVQITVAEREMAILLLEIITGSFSREKTIQKTKDLFNQNVQTLRALNDSDLDEIFDKTERMDRFVYLVSYLNESGFKLPTSVVHWVLAINRMASLGKTIGYGTEARLRNLILTRKLGGELETYNRLSLVWNQIANVVRPQPRHPQSACVEALKRSE